MKLFPGRLLPANFPPALDESDTLYKRWERYREQTREFNQQFNLRVQTRQIRRRHLFETHFARISQQVGGEFRAHRREMARAAVKLNWRQHRVVEGLEAA